MPTGSHEYDRRDFLQSIARGAALGGLAGTGWISHTLAAPVRFPLDPQLVMWKIQHTPRDKVVEATIELLNEGVTYREFIRGLFLEGIREINPHPPGFKLHAVLSMSAVNQISRELPDTTRWLPLIWSFDLSRERSNRTPKKGISS